MDAGCTLILLLLLLTVSTVAGCFVISERKKRKELCKDIEMLLAGFTDHRGIKPENSRDYETSSKDLDRIYRQLMNIQSNIKVLQDKTILEQEEIKSIVTDIAHQLKTPVAVMDMSLSLLEDESLSPEDRREFTGRLRSSMKELETLMDSLIQISRMESGLIDLNLKENPLADTIMTATNCVFLKADEKKIGFQLEDAEKITEIPVLHDSKWLAEAFINVFENSIKYSPEGSCITIRPSLRNGFIRIEIEDQGIGIPKDERNKVLARFYRGKAKTVQEESGSGVGLFLVNKILRMHGGMVLIRSGKGQAEEFPGTILVLQLPVARV